MYAHALRKREELGLNAVEVIDTRERVYDNFFMGLFGTIYGGYRLWQDTLHVQTLTYVGAAITCAIGLASWLLVFRLKKRTETPTPEGRLPTSKNETVNANC